VQKEKTDCTKRNQEHSRKRGCSAFLKLDGEGLEPVTKVCAEFLVLEAQLDGGAKEALLVTGIMTLAFVAEAVDLFVLQQRLDAVGKLKFATCAGCDRLEHLEDTRREDVASDDGVL
jgi:hypothetical protein